MLAVVGCCSPLWDVARYGRMLIWWPTRKVARTKSYKQRLLSADLYRGAIEALATIVGERTSKLHRSPSMERHPQTQIQRQPAWFARPSRFQRCCNLDRQALHDEMDGCAV
jgi:hypothetical protein